MALIGDDARAGNNLAAPSMRAKPEAVAITDGATAAVAISACGRNYFAPQSDELITARAASIDFATDLPVRQPASHRYLVNPLLPVLLLARTGESESEPNEPGCVSASSNDVIVT